MSRKGCGHRHKHDFQDDDNRHDCKSSGHSPNSEFRVNRVIMMMTDDSFYYDKTLEMIEGSIAVT